MADLKAQDATENSIESNQDVKDDATQISEMEEVGISFSPDELASVTESTLATLHVVNGSSIEKKPLSSRVHIKTPNPSVDQTKESLTTPYHICCVLDISGSMCISVKPKDENGNAVEDIGLSVLDIVKFATLVVAESLNPQDMLSIVTYSNDAATVLPPTFMTADGKAKAKAVLEDVRTWLRTNIYAGLEAGVKHAHEVGDGFIHSVFLLTDGFPTMHPEEEYDVCIPKLFANNPFPGSLSTFGFGCNLDSKLLVDIAKMGGGYYSFIPDAGMVGTCFINALANSKCAFGVNPVLKISGCDFKMLSKLKVMPKELARRNASNEKKSLRRSLAKMMSRRTLQLSDTLTGLTLDECLESELKDKVIYVRLTPLRYGCDVDIMLKPELFTKDRDSIKIELVFETVGGTSKTLDVIPADSNAADELYHSKRALFVKNGFSMPISPYDEATSNTFTDLAGYSDANSNLAALYEDMKGEATEAISSEENFKKWGKHFLMSLSTAHLHQFCNNFRDPGVQLYGTGELFSSLQDTFDDVFEQVPPAVPTSFSAAKNNGATVQMSHVFNNRNTTCVHGKTVLRVKAFSPQKLDKFNDKVDYFSTPSSSATSFVPICNIKKGDLVLAADGTYVKVECVVETVVDESQPPFELIKVGHLCVTPYHPVKVNHLTGWQFPIQVTDSKLMVPNGDKYTAAYSVYNLVLENGQRHNGVLMDGVETITLGHGITDDVILQHAYFGTDKIINDLKAISGGDTWNVGHIILKEKNINRDSLSGCISLISEIKDINEEEKMTVRNLPLVRCVT